MKLIIFLLQIMYKWNSQIITLDHFKKKVERYVQ